MDCIKISAVIITLNEEKNIQECIDSLKDVVDEIVVVDSHSIDKTEEICKNNGVRFLHHEWEGHGGQKNWGNAQASYDYILSLDADERLSDDLKKAILVIKKDWQSDVYSVNRLTYFHGRKMKYGFYPDRQLRLFDRRKAQWNSTFHDRIIINKGVKLKSIRKDVLHYANKDIHELVDTLNNNSTLFAQDRIGLGKPSYLKLIFSPIFEFIKTYFLKLGFLEGVFGFIISLNMAHYRFLKYAKRIELYKINKQKQ